MHLPDPLSQSQPCTNRQLSAGREGFYSGVTECLSLGEAPPARSSKHCMCLARPDSFSTFSTPFPAANSTAEVPNC